MRPTSDKVTVWADANIDEILAAVEADDLAGFCVSCGAEHGPVEPDARYYRCECCNESAVFGSQELLFYTTDAGFTVVDFELR